MRFALSPDHDGTEAGEARLATHTFGHFEILLGTNGWPAELGRGAMGVTYRARDTNLHTEVALKVIGGNVAGHPAARAAFLREARAAARLRHPNVASVFHYGEQDGQCFYVMELVEGETLEARLRREGPLSPPLALEICRQVACALMEAEALSMVHRDLKPSNLMFVARRGDRADDQPHVKVIDFGLAQAADLAETEDGGFAPTGFAGTPSFASPEQFARDGAQGVDTRSDIYSLGVTLWYLLCGKLPFSGSTLTGIHAQHSQPVLPLEQLRAARVPGSVIGLLQRMLQVDPRERPASARVLIEEIQRCQAAINPDHPSTARRWWAVAAMLLALGVLMAVFLKRGERKDGKSSQPPPVPADRSVAVLPFENLSADPKLAYYSDGTHDQIAYELANIAQMRVVTANEGTAPPPGKRDLGQVARDLGVVYLVEGGVWREGDRMRVTIRLVDTHDPARNWSHQYEGAVAEEFNVQRTLTRELVSRLRATLTPAEDAALNQPPTTDPVAYDLYLRAYQSPSTYNTAEETRRGFAEQVTLLEQAVARDPKFVAAYCALAAVHDRFQSLHGNGATTEDTVDHRTQAEIALQNARRLAPDDGMVHQAQALHFFQSSYDNKQARYEIDLARKTLPNNAELEQTAGLIARSAGDWDEAVRCFEKADALQPRELAILNPLSWMYRNLRLYPQADATLARIIALKSPKNGLPNRLSRATIPMEERADIEPLRATLAEEEKSLTDEDSVRRLNYSRMILALWTHDADALSHFAAQVPADRPFRSFHGTVYPNAWFEGMAARMRGDDAAARTAFAAARVEVERVFQADPSNDRALSLLAVIDAGLGHKEDAIREARRACDMLVRQNAQIVLVTARCQLATVYAWTGERDQALALLDELAGGAAESILWYHVTYGDLRLNPVWDPLRGDPRFEALTRRLAPRPTP